MITRRWEGETVAILASGPSLNGDEVDSLRGRCKVVAVNDSWRLCPWADMLYAADHRWWQYHNYVSWFRGERWTQHKGVAEWSAVARENGLTVINSANAPGISFNPSIIHTGSNSTFQALNIAVLQGCTKILLLGLDCRQIDGKRHWFGDHPGKLNRDSPYSLFIDAFNAAAPQLTDAGIEVINCSLESAVDCFLKQRLEEVLL